MNRSVASVRIVSAALAAATLSAFFNVSRADEPTLAHVTQVARVVEVPVDKNALSVEGHPLTSVVVTQCNLIVAVYMTMPDGRLLRFDKSAGVPSQQLMTMAYSAPRSERVEVSCNDTGAAGYEHHEPI